MKKIFRLRVPLVCAALGLALLAGCGASSSSTAYAEAEQAPAMPEAAYDAATEEAANAGEAGGDGGSPTLTAPQDDRKVILNADLNIEALEFNKTCDALQQAAAEAGGYISQTKLGGSEEYHSRYAHFTFRIPAEKYSGFIHSATAAGNLVSRSEGSTDVTAQYVDIESRLASLRAQEQRLLELMEESGSLEDLLLVQQQLTEVQYELENYIAQQRSLDGLTAYSTVNVTVTEVQEFTETPPDTYGTRVSQAFVQSWLIARDFLQELSIAIVYLIPLLVVAAVILVVVLVLVRRSRKKRAKKLAENPPAPAAVPSWPGYPAYPGSAYPGWPAPAAQGPRANGAVTGPAAGQPAEKTAPGQVSPEAPKSGESGPGEGEK